MSEPIAILNGRFVPVSEATLSVFDTGFVHGAAVGDMMRTFHHKPFRVEDHLQRFRRGIEALHIDDAPDDATLQDAIDDVVKHNAGLISRQHDLGIIVFATPGGNLTYTGATAATQPPECTWGVHTFPLPFELWAEKMQHGQQLMIGTTRHIPPECLNPTIKWRNRLHWFLADREVRRVNPQASALLLDTNGYLTETSTASLFIVKNDCILTPRPENTLESISRRVVLELAEGLGIPCDFADLTVEDACDAAEAFTASTPYCLMPVAAIDNRPIGEQVPGAVFCRLLQAWSELVSLDILDQIVTGAQERRRAG